MVTVEQLRTVWNADASSWRLVEFDRALTARLTTRVAAVRPTITSPGARGLTSMIAMIALIWAIVPIAVGQTVQSSCFDRIGDVPARPVGIVFGAGVTASGRLTPVLRARIDAAVELFHAHKISKLLMTGDDAHVYHNEPSAMRRYAIHLGVPASDIACDYAGFRTYDSCYRARQIFGVQSAVLITQGFHLSRAVFTARALGIDAVGYAADNPLRRLSTVDMALRENSCLLAGICDLALHRKPHFMGKAEPIVEPVNGGGV